MCPFRFYFIFQKRDQVPAIRWTLNPEHFNENQKKKNKNQFLNYTVSFRLEFFELKKEKAIRSNPIDKMEPKWN